MSEQKQNDTQYIPVHTICKLNQSQFFNNFFLKTGEKTKQKQIKNMNLLKILI